MSTSIFFERFYALCRKHHTSPNAVGALLGASSGSITAWKKGVLPRSAMVSAIADHFQVSVDYLLGESDTPQRVSVTDEELKFALFGGEGEITDEMLDEVRQFAAFLKQRKG
jgi:transcriptional regulator with XRE-family HTH domain